MFGRTTRRSSIRSRLSVALGSAALMTSLVGTIAPVVVADPSSPVSVVKTASSNPVASGAQLTYTIVVTNLGGSKVNDIVMTDQVNGVGVIQSPPALPQLTITSTKGSCTQGGPNGNLVTCNAGSMAGREVWTVTIRGQVTAPNNTTLNNTASVTGTKSAQTFTTTGSTSVLVSGGTGGGDLPDLSINKTGPTSVAPSTAFAYTLTINNIGTANTSNVLVVDTLPAGVTLVSTSTTSLFTCTDNAPTDPITVVCTGGAVNQGQNATITLNVISPAATGPITNTAVVDPDDAILESNELNNTSSFVTSVGGPPPDELLSIIKTDGNPDIGVPWDTGAGPDPVNPGEELVYWIQVMNNATSRADDVRITDTTQGLEASSMVVSMVVVDGAIGVGGGCQVVAPHAICEVRSLQSGGTITMTVRGMVIAAAGSTLFNTATVHGNIKNVGVTNTATEATTVRPSIDLTITKDDGPDPACARTWPTTTDPNQHLANPPDGLAAAGGSIPDDPAVPGPNDGLLAPPVCLGGLTYSFVIGNSGNGNATNVTVRDALPAGLIFDSYESTAGFVCAVDGANVVTCTGGAIAAADTETLTFRLVAPPTVGSITNSVSVDPNNAIFEPDETNNTDSETTTITTGVDLVIWKGDDKFVADPPDTDGDPSDEDPPGLAPPLLEGFDPIATSGTQTYTIIVDNVGPQDVTGITVRDVLPAGTKFLSFSATNGFTCTHDGSTFGGNVTCIGGHLFGTEAEFYDPPGPTGPTFGMDDRATIVIKAFATPFVQPIMHNEVRVDPDNAIAEINELNNSAFQNTFVGVGGGGEGAFHQLTIDKIQCDPAPAPAPCDNPPIPNFVADPSFSVAQNGTVWYDLKVSNLGTDPVSAIVVKDFLPSGSRFIEASDTDVGPTLSDAFFCFHDGSAFGGVVTCLGGDLSGSVNKIPDPVLPAVVPTERHIRIKIFAPGTPGTYPNIVVVDPDNTVPEGNEFDNDDAVLTTVTVGGNNMFNDLTITKCDQPSPPDDDPGCTLDRDPVAPSGEMRYILTVSNLGSDPAFDVKVTDNLPVGTIFVSAEDLAPGVGAFDCVHAAGVITCTGGTIDGSLDLVPAPVGPSRMIEIILIAPNAKGPITNQAFVDPGNAIPEGNETNNSDSETTNIVPRINLKLDKNGPDTAHQNDVDEYVITVTNEAPTGDGLTANDVVVVDALPIGLIPLYIEAPSNFICEFTENPVNGVRCVGDMSAEGADPDTHVAEIKIGVFVTAEEGPLDNEACVDPTDPAHPEGFIIESDEGDNCKTKTTTVLKLSPDLNVNKSADTATATPGQTITYTVTVSNTGDATALGPITVTDDLTPGANPLKVDYVSASATNGYTCSFTSPDLIECTGGSLAPGDATVITIKVKVKTGATGSVLNEARVPDNTAFDPAAGECAGSACADEAAANTSSTNANNSATESVSLTGTGIDLVMLSLEDDIDATTPGGIVTYTANVSNSGTANADDVVVRLTLPATGLNHVISSASNGFTCEFLFPNIDCEGDLPAGGTTEVTLVTHVTAVAPPDTSVTVTAKVDPDNTIVEDDETNNELSQTTTVTGSCAIPCVDLVASPIVASPDPVNAGDLVTFIVGVGNAGDTATGTFDIELKLDGAAFTFDGGFQSAQPSDDYSATPGATTGFDCTFNLIDTLTCTGDLNGGQGVLIILKVRVTDPPTDNSLSLQVTADSGTSEAESNELNNEATGSVTVVDTP
jgi:uncharacterized repeat protein (TIGR01451 family)